MNSLWINWRVFFWRLQIGRDWPWVRVCWHCDVHKSCGCVFCDLNLEATKKDGHWVHATGTGMGDVRCTYPAGHWP